MELDLALKMLNRKGKERMMIKVHKHKGHKNHGPARVSLRMRTYYQLVNFAYKVRTQLPGVEDMFAKALKDKKDLYSNPLLANVFAPWPKKGSSGKMQAGSMSKRLNIGVKNVLTSIPADVNN